MSRRRGIMSESFKYELAKDLGFYDVVQREGWEGIRTKDAGNMVKRAIQIAQEQLVKQYNPGASLNQCIKTQSTYSQPSYSQTNFSQPNLNQTNYSQPTSNSSTTLRRIITSPHINLFLPHNPIRSLNRALIRTYTVERSKRNLHMHLLPTRRIRPM